MSLNLEILFFILKLFEDHSILLKQFYLDFDKRMNIAEGKER